MKPNTRLLIVAIFLGLVTVAALYLYLGNADKPVVDRVSQAEVVVAQKTIPAHSRISADMLEIASLPVDSIHPEAVLQIEDAVGGIARSEVIMGEQLLAGRVFNEGRQGTLSYRIPENMRAIAIPVTEVTGVAGYVSAGDKVDVLVTYHGSSDVADDTVTYTTFQNIVVLAVGDNPLEKDDQERQVVGTVTLCVSPAQAEVLAFAYLTGSFHLTLRSPTDDYMVTLDYYGPRNLASFTER